MSKMHIWKSVVNEERNEEKKNEKKKKVLEKVLFLINVCVAVGLVNALKSGGTCGARRQQLLWH